MIPTLLQLTLAGLSEDIAQALKHKKTAESLADEDPDGAAQEREIAIALLLDVSRRVEDDAMSYRVDLHLAEVYCSDGQFAEGQELIGDLDPTPWPDERVRFDRVSDSCGFVDVEVLPPLPAPVEEKHETPPPEARPEPVLIQPTREDPPATLAKASPPKRETSSNMKTLGRATVGAGAALFAYAAMSEYSLANDVGEGSVEDAEWEERKRRTNAMYGASYGLLGVGGAVWLAGSVTSTSVSLGVSGTF